MAAGRVPGSTVPIIYTAVGRKVRFRVDQVQAIEDGMTTTAKPRRKRKPKPEAA
jgi:hypothetical protein